MPSSCTILIVVGIIVPKNDHIFGFDQKYLSQAHFLQILESIYFEKCSFQNNTSTLILLLKSQQLKITEPPIPLFV